MTIRRHLGILLILPIVLTTTSCGVSLPLSDLLFPNRDGGSSTNLTPAGSGGKAGALREGNFRNGAEFLWTLDAEDVGGGRWEMPHDDPTTGLAAGPIAAGGVWLAKVIPAGSGLYEANTLVALDPARGEVIWSKEEAGWEDCVAGPGGREFLCVFDDGRVAYLDPESGVERVLLHAKQGARSFAAATADGAVVIQETGGLTLGIHGVAPDGTERYAKTIDLEAEAVYDFKPLSALGGQAQFSGYDESIVFDLATGAEQGRFRGSVWLTGEAAIVLPKGAEATTSAAGVRMVEIPEDQDAQVPSDGDTVVGVRTDPGGVQVCGPILDGCVQVPGTQELWEPSWSAVLDQIDGRTYLSYVAHQSGHTAVIDVEKATLLGIFSEYSGWEPTPAAEALLPARVDMVNWDNLWGEGRKSIRHPLTGATLGVLNSDAGSLAPADVAPGYAVIGWDREEWSLGTRYLTAFGAATEPKELRLTGESEQAASVPDGLPTCPEGTFLLAWATFPNGSITVCGYHIDDPTVVIHVRDGQEMVSSHASFDGVSTYLGRLSDGGTMSLSFESGVFEIVAQDGAIEMQTRSDLIWFVALGQWRPSAGQFDVTLPDATAEGQVRYLTELLASSKSARSSLVEANTSLRECSKGPDGDYADEIVAIDKVTRNRAELLSALAAAPVDLVPEGQALLEELRVSIRHSLDADIAFAAWARGIQRDGCTGASSGDGVTASEKATAAKQVFVARWNNVIVPEFLVASLAAADV